MAHAMSHWAWRMATSMSKEDLTMLRNITSLLPSDPDALVFWLVSTLSAMFMLIAPVPL
jgi:hypothetical protein